MTLQYYLSATPRRKLLDKLLTEHQHLFNGAVVDIGGRDRGRFIKPRNRVASWTFVDIEATHRPDIIGDVTNLHQIHDHSADIVLAAELFEHVYDAPAGLRECYRILKPGGVLIASMPFLYPIHGDPHDWHRWTEHQWQSRLQATGFTKIKIVVMGRFFTLANHWWRELSSSLPYPLRLMCYAGFPIFDLLQQLDNSQWIQAHSLHRWHGGYFLKAHRV